MTRYMYDAIDTRRIPAGAAMVAGYVNGRWPSFYGYQDASGQHVPSLAAAFPNAIKVSIAVSADADADVLDCEMYDATPAQCPGWAARQRGAGRLPTVYMNRSTWPLVAQQFAAQRVPMPNWWVADYDGIDQLAPGAVAKQYRNTPGYDLSVVADHWPGIDADPAPPPHRKVNDMLVLILTAESGGKDGYWLTGSKMVPSVDNAARQSHKANGGLIETWPAAEAARVAGALNG